MFSKLSRYRKLPDVVTTDAKGRALRSKSLRLLPEVSGDFFHTVEEIDRLDHLAYKYYRQPRKWWRICDANPAFMSPQGLLGGEPLVTARFPLAFTGPHPPWSELLQALSETVGVDQAWMDGGRRLPEVQITLGSAPLFQMPPAFQAELKDGLVADNVRAEFEKGGVSLSLGTVVFREANGWLVADEEKGKVFAVLPVAGPGKRKLYVYDCVLRYEGSVLVTYNRINVSGPALTHVAEALGFVVGETETIGQLGKQIVIPPDSVR